MVWRKYCGLDLVCPGSALFTIQSVHFDAGGHRRSAEPKQVMFSDGIRPGGDLTELDGSAEVTRMPPRRSRVQKKVERHSQGGCILLCSRYAVQSCL